MRPHYCDVWSGWARSLAGHNFEVVTSPLFFLSAKLNFPFFLFLYAANILEVSFLNADRVKRKLPSLLVDRSTTKKSSWNSLTRDRYRFAQFKKRQPEKFNSITNRILLDLTYLEKAANELNDFDWRHKTS
jgi:hypothetical protein